MQRIDQLRSGLAGTRWRMLASETAIQPIIVGDNADTVTRRRGPARTRPVGTGDPPPTVPKGTARRVSLSAARQRSPRRRPCLMP